MIPDEKPTGLQPFLSFYISQAPDKATAEKAVEVLNRGYELSLAKLNAITEVTKENREAIVEELSTIKKYYDKIYSHRQPFTQLLDEMKKAIMFFERPSDYKDKNSLYSQKRALVEAFDEEERKEAERKKALAEKEKQITVYLANLKANVQRCLVEMIATKKRMVIESMAKWEQGLTLENLEESEKKLVDKKPQLARADYDKCFHLNFQKMTIVPADEDREIIENCIQRRAPDNEYPQRLMKRNDELHLAFFKEIQVDETYDKYNEQYVTMIAEVVNATRARIPEIRKELKDSKDRSAAIRQRAEDQKTAVAEQTELQLDTVTQEKDLNVMEANFNHQAVTQGLPDGPTVDKIEFEDGQFVRAFLEMIQQVASLPSFPGIFKKGKMEFVDGVKWWVTLYEKNINKDKPIKGIRIVEKAKTTIRSQS